MFLKFYLPFFQINVVANLFHHFFRGIRKLKALVTATVVGSVARIILTVLLVDSIGIHGIYVGWVMSWLADGIVGVGVYFGGKWKDELQTKNNLA